MQMRAFLKLARRSPRIRATGLFPQWDTPAQRLVDANALARPSAASELTGREVSTSLGYSLAQCPTCLQARDWLSSRLGAWEAIR
jgi:hypothetical protein